MDDTSSPDQKNAAGPERLRYTPRFSVTPNMQLSHRRFLASDIKLLESGQFADVRVICGDKTWNLHKTILCTRSDFFLKAFDGKFIEAHTNTINIHGYSIEILSCVIHYLYTGVVNIEKADTDDSMISACARLWAAADYFIIPALMTDVLVMLDEYFENVKLTYRMICGLTSAVQSTTLDRLFRGIETAYVEFPHAQPVQQRIVKAVCLTRWMSHWSMRPGDFEKRLASTSHDFTHDLLMATLPSDKESADGTGNSVGTQNQGSSASEW